MPKAPPKYVVVRDYLKGLIRDGLGVGEPIPSERELCDRFSVSRMTVRQAIDTLVVDGALERQQGRGTFVAPAKVDLQLRLTSFTEEMRRRGMTPGSRTLAGRTLPADEGLADTLEVEPGAPVHYLRRLRTADGVPMAIEDNWVSAALLPDLLEPQEQFSVYAMLTAHNMRPDWGEDVIEARVIGPADGALLDVPDHAPWLYISRRTYRGHQAVGYSHTLYRADRYSLWVPVASPRPTLMPPNRTSGVAR